MSTLCSFSVSGPDGHYPEAAVVLGPGGDFYGTTAAGGANGFGTVFKVTKLGVLTTLHSFTGFDGAQPTSRLLWASDGNFYGTTRYGGAGFPGGAGIGTIFRITPAGVLTPLYLFQGGADGGAPSRELIEGSDGYLYGTSDTTTGTGAIFRITKSGTFALLHAFTGAEGFRPMAGLIEGPNGTFYGTTSEGGFGTFAHGTVFRLTLPAGPIPTITGINPPSGPSLGGTPVTITGTDFQAGATVTIGGVAAAVTSVTPTQILATTGPHVAAVVDVAVTNPDSGFATLPGSFTYTCGSTAPTAAVSGTAGICAGSSAPLSVALTGAGPWTLNWADGFVQSGIASSPATRSVSPSSTTTYSVTTVADANCVGAGTGGATVTVTQVPSATIAAPAAACQNASGLAASVPNAGAGATYSWTIANGTITSGAGTNAIVFSVGTASPAQLDVTVTLNGCNKSGSVTIPVTPLATATVTGSAAICAGSSTTIQAALTGTSPWTVHWNDGVIQSGIGASPATRLVTPAASTSYSVTFVSDVTGCAGTSSGVADIVVKPAPGALITPSATQMCPGASGNTASTPDVGVGATYSWTITNGTITAGAGTHQVTFMAGASGNVTLGVTVTGSNGCSSSDTRVLPIRSTPTAVLTGPAAACSGQPTSLSVNLTGQPPWNLKWSDGFVQVIQTSPATRAVTLAADTTFSLTSLADGSGCIGTVSGSVSISVHQAPTAVVSGEGTVCSGDSVTISAVVTSAGPFTAQWNDGPVQTGTGSTTLTRVVNPTGTTVYKIDAISDGTCSAPGAGVALIVVGLDPRAAIVTAPFDVCAGASGVTASVPDAGAGASYAWSILNGTIDSGQGTHSVTFTAGDTGEAHLSAVVQVGSGCQVSGRTDVRIGRKPQAPSITAPVEAMSGDSLVASVPAAGSDVFKWTVENGALTAGQGTNTILFTAGLPGKTTLRVIQTTVQGCSSDAGVQSIPVSGFSATRIVPVVVSVAGSGGAQFSSELTLSNPGASSAHVELTLTPADALGGGAGSTISQDLEPGRQLVIPDALAFFAQQGAARAALNAAASGGGSVRASFTNLPAKAIVYAGARTTALSGPGRAGLSYGAPAAEELFDGRIAIYGLRETAAERTNLALENAGTSGPIGLRVTLVSGAGDERFVLPDTVFLQPGQWLQIGSILTVAGYSSGWALVERVSGTEPFYAYGVANDNATNDGAFLDAVSATRAPSVQVVPAIVETGAFGTELVLVNPGLAASTVSLNFVESLANPLGSSTGFVAVTLKPGEQRFIPDVVDYLRAHGASVGPQGMAYAGPLFVQFTSGGTVVDGYVASRTSTPAAGGGKYGVSYPGVTLAESASAEAWVFGLQQNGANRSNFAMLNAAANLGPISLRYDVFDGFTGAKAGSVSVKLYPGQWMQVNSILRNFGLANGYVRVTRTAGVAPWVAYGILNDGA
ncbi:MAG: beta strand repeat-containing protein, partial [Acidobacteriota bacterium]